MRLLVEVQEEAASQAESKSLLRRSFDCLDLLLTLQEANLADMDDFRIMNLIGHRAEEGALSSQVSFLM